MAVGGRDMLSTSNYEARKYGVRAAMPGFIGKKLCPDLIIVPVHFGKYREISQQVRGVLAEYDPNFVSVSLDEAYLDLTELLEERRKDPPRKFLRAQNRRDGLNDSSGSVSGGEAGEPEMVEFGNDVEGVVREMRFKIEQKTQLTASAGIAPNAMLAKVCSDRNKPNGQFYLKPDRENVVDFVQNLPIRKISGIGRVSQQMLKALGIETCADLYTRRALIHLLHSQISCRFLMRVCLGLGETRLEGGGPRKSLGTETTFTEISQPHELYKVCERLTQDVVKSLTAESLKAKTVTIKLKTVAFDAKVRSHSFPAHVSSLEEIFPAAKDLLCREIKACHPKPLRLRLMGVRLSNFQACDSGQNRESRQDTITSFLSRKKPALVDSSTAARNENAVSFDGASFACTIAEEACVREAPDTFSLRQDSTNSRSDIPSCSSGFGDTTESGVAQSSPGPQSETKAAPPQHIDPSVASNTTTLICPVCSGPQTSSKARYLEDFNEHVDLCLSKSAIKEMLSKDKEISTQQNLLVERNQNPQEGSRKRRKSDSRGSSKKRTLHAFWAK